MMLCFPWPRKSQLGCNTKIPQLCLAVPPHQELYPAVFHPSSPRIAALPPATGTGGQSPSKIIPSACGCEILSGGSFMSPTAFCWQVVLPGNLQWGEEGNSASGTNSTPNWGGGPPKPLQ